MRVVLRVFASKIPYVLLGLMLTMIRRLKVNYSQVNITFYENTFFIPLNILCQVGYIWAY